MGEKKQAFDPQNISDEEVAEFQEFMEHPWVVAAKAGVSMYPLPTSIGIEPYDFMSVNQETGVEKENQAALLTVIDPTGIKTVFLNPELVSHMMGLCAAIMQHWAEQPAKGLIVPNANQAAQAKQIHEQQATIRGKS